MRYNMGSTTTVGSNVLLNRTSDPQPQPRPSGGTKPPGRWNSRSHPVDPFELSRRLRAVLAQQQKTDLPDAAVGCPDLDSYENRLLAAGCTDMDDYANRLLSVAPGTVRPPTVTTAQTALDSSFAATVKTSIARKPAKPAKSAKPVKPAKPARSAKLVNSVNTTKPLPKPPKLAEPPLSRSSTRHNPAAFSPAALSTAVAAASADATAATAPAPLKQSTPAPPSFYVPQQAAQQFAWTTVTPSLRKGSTSLRRHRKKTSRQEDEPVLIEAVEEEVQESQKPQKPQEPSKPDEPAPRQSFVITHALEDALVFPKGNEAGNKHNRKILSWAHSTHAADALKEDRPDQRRLSSTSAGQDSAERYKPDDRAVAAAEAEARQDWSIVFAPIDPQILDLHRVDWTQKDENALTPLTSLPSPPPPKEQEKLVPTKSGAVRRSKSLWMIGSRPSPTQDSKASADTQATSPPSAVTSPSPSSASPESKLPPKPLRFSSKNGLFSHIPHTNFALSCCVDFVNRSRSRKGCVQKFQKSCAVGLHYRPPSASRRPLMYERSPWRTSCFTMATAVSWPTVALLAFPAAPVLPVWPDSR